MKFNEGGAPQSQNPIHQEITKRILERGDTLEKIGEHVFLDFPNYDPIEKRDYQAVFKKVINPGDKVLAVGVGTVDIIGNVNHQVSTLLEVAKEKGAEVILSDIRPHNLITHKDNKELLEHTHVHLVAADATKLPLADSSIEGVTSSNLINCPPKTYGVADTLHEQASLLLKEFYRVLKPGGFALITSFGYASQKEGDKRVYNNDIAKEEILTLKELERFMEEVGFVDVRELMPSDERHAQVDISYSSANFEEEGGFIARKPRT